MSAPLLCAPRSARFNERNGIYAGIIRRPPAVLIITYRARAKYRFLITAAPCLGRLKYKPWRSESWSARANHLEKTAECSMRIPSASPPILSKI